MKKIILVLITIMGLTSNSLVFAAAPTRLNNFLSDTTIRASEVNEDFNNLYGYLNAGVSALAEGAIDNINEILTAIKSGVDSQLITGTEGASGTIPMFNSDGDLVDSGAAIATGANLTIISEIIVGDPLTGSSAGTTLCISATNKICRCNSCD